MYLRVFTLTKRINKKSVVLLHSEGGMIAQMLAANNKDVAFIVLLAAPGCPFLNCCSSRPSSNRQGASVPQIVSCK